VEGDDLAWSHCTWVGSVTEAGFPFTVSCLRVLIRRATGGERRMIRTDVLLVPSVTVRLFADLVDFEPLGD